MFTEEQMQAIQAIDEATHGNYGLILLVRLQRAGWEVIRRPEPQAGVGMAQ